MGKVGDALKRMLKGGADLRAGPNRRLESLRRQARSYLERDEEEKLNAYIRERQRADGGRWVDGKFETGGGPVKKRKGSGMVFMGRGRL